MREDMLIERLREAIRRRSAMPAKEWFAEMVRCGILDEQGQVLLRAPQPPAGVEQQQSSPNGKQTSAD